MSDETIDLTRFGGQRMSPETLMLYGESSTTEAWNFGANLRESLDDEQRAMDDENLASMQPFGISGSWQEPEGPFGSWIVAKRVNRGEHFLTFYQQTGSCVGNGVGQVMRAVAAEEAYRLGQAEKVILPFYLYTYGRSRFHGGMRGRGEGSFGSAAAKAAREDGILDADLAGLPKPSMNPDEGITWGRSTELQWSDGGAISQEWLTLGRKHLVRSVAQAKSVDDIWEAVCNGYYVTIASNWGGLMKCPVVGNPPVLMNRRSGTWMHQMGVHGGWNHPEFKRLYYILNSWGPKVHGICPSGAQPGGFWIKEAEMASIVAQKEAFIFSQFDGFPAQEWSWKSF